MSYKGVYDFLGPIVRRFFNIRVSGTENEPLKGPFIVCANHMSDSDPIILDAALRHQLRYFAKEELFRIPLFRRLIIALGAYPVKRGMSDVRAIRKTIEILENGEVVGMFPQGTRHPGVNPCETEVKSGVGMMAWRAKSPVLPVLIQTKGWRVAPFKRVNVIIGRLIGFDEFGFTNGNKAEYDSASALIFERITELITDPDGGDNLLLPAPKEKFELIEGPKNQVRWDG
jgi:1-acyl-sn-glycerol-3-phosphate acyltransferase